MLYKLIIIIAALGLLTGGPSAADEAHWKLTLGFKHPQPGSVDHFDMYCRNMYQTWAQGFHWEVPNNMTAPMVEQDFTTPDVLPVNNYYCCVVTATDHFDRETPLPAFADPNETNWDCLWIKPEDMKFVE